jgi:hypothetical protein
MFGLFRRHEEPIVASSATTRADSVAFVRLATLINRYPRRVELAPSDKALLRETWNNPPTWTIILPAADAPLRPVAPAQPYGVMLVSTAGAEPVTGGPAW